MAEMTTCIPAPPSHWCPNFILCEARTVDPTHPPWGSSSALGPPLHLPEPALPCGAGAGVWPTSLLAQKFLSGTPSMPTPSPTPVTARFSTLVVAQSMLIR